MMDIRDKNGTVRASVEITDRCVYSKTLMEEEYVLLAFESDTLIGFAKGDYIETENGVFRIVALSPPRQSADGGYAYEQKFHAHWERWRNHITFYDRQRGSEKSWKMTQRPEYFLDIICRNIRNAGYGDFSFEIDAGLTGMKMVEFDSTNIIDALSRVAESWETEWWISDGIIHLSKCEFGTPLSLSENDELGIIEREDGSDTGYFTRAYVFGSTRNLPKDYRKDDESSPVIEGVVESRLRLPAGIPYIDAWEDMKPEDVVEGVILLDEIYPRKTGTVSTVAAKKYTDEIENEDGSVTYRDWNAFRFTDTALAGLKFSSDYILPGEELRIIFQTGKLAGMDFAVIFNPDGLNESLPQAQLFEIVRNEDYGVALPSDDFKPEVGDTYLLYGYDTRFVYDRLIAEAEAELYDRGVEKLTEASRDKSVYTCPTNPVRCAGYKEDAARGLIHSPADEIDLDMGQAVTLHSLHQFADGSLVSRVRGFEKKLRNKYEALYTIGETSAYSRGDALEEKVQQLTYQSRQFLSVYGNSIYVVGRYDTTAPSDVNVPSFRRAQYEFLNKTAPDRTPYALSVGGRLTAEGEATVRGRLTAEGGAQFGPSFAPGLTGFGGLIDAEGNGELESLTLRRWLEVPELRYNRVTLLNSVYWMTAGHGIVDEVWPDLDADGTPEPTGTLRLKLEEGEPPALAPDDICMGIWHDTAQTDPDSDDGRGNFIFRGFRTVYFRVTEMLSGGMARYSLRPGWPAHPSQAMHFAAYGNFTDPTRQMSRYETTSYSRYLRGVCDWEFGEDNVAAQFGDLSNLIISGREMKGYSAYLHNIYMSGVIEQFERFEPELSVTVTDDEGAELGADAVALGPGQAVTLSARVTRFFEEVADTAFRWSRDTGDRAADALWNAGTGLTEAALRVEHADLGEAARPRFAVEATVPYKDGTILLRRSVVLARLVPVVTDRGRFIRGDSYYAGDTVGPGGVMEISDVWHIGQRWRCLVTATPDAPGFASAAWLHVEGDDELHVSFDRPEMFVNPLTMDYELALSVRWHGQDVTPWLDPATDVEWSRYSTTRAGEERTGLDAAWTAAHRRSGLSRRMTTADLDWGLSSGVGKMRFKVTVTLRDPARGTAPTGELTWELGR